MESHVRHRLFLQRHMYPSFTRVVSVSSILEPHWEHCWQLAKSLTHEEVKNILETSQYNEKITKLHVL